MLRFICQECKWLARNPKYLCISALKINGHPWPPTFGLKRRTTVCPRKDNRCKLYRQQNLWTPQGGLNLPPRFSPAFKMLGKSYTIWISMLIPDHIHSTLHSVKDYHVCVSLWMVFASLKGHIFDDFQKLRRWMLLGIFVNLDSKGNC